MHSGTVSGKSYEMFTLNQGLLARCVEAVKEGDALARRTGQIQSFEIFRNGHRMNLVIGRIMVVPPSVCDDKEDFPVALLYGALVKLIRPEDLADLMAAQIGDTEFDDYSEADMQEIKNKLFRVPGGNKFASLIVFLPSWTSPREYVMFPFTKNDSALANALRHLVFAAYFDPRLSSAFDSLMQDTDTVNHGTELDVTNITPKLPFVDVAENVRQEYPDLQSADETLASQERPTGPDKKKRKAASAYKRKVALTLDAAEHNEDVKSMLSEGEVDVIDAVTDAAEAAILHKRETPADAAADDNAAKKANGLRRRPDYKAASSFPCSFCKHTEASEEALEAHKNRAHKTAQSGHKLMEWCSGTPMEHGDHKRCPGVVDGVHCDCPCHEKAEQEGVVASKQAKEKDGPGEMKIKLKLDLSDAMGESLAAMVGEAASKAMADDAKEKNDKKKEKEDKKEKKEKKSSLEKKAALPCECSDPGCPKHRGSDRCGDPAVGIAYRVDMDDQTGTPMCEECLADAADSGVFRIEELGPEGAEQSEFDPWEHVSSQKTADTADNPANEKGGEGAIQVKTETEIKNTRGEEPELAPDPNKAASLRDHSIYLDGKLVMVASAPKTASAEQVKDVLVTKFAYDPFITVVAGAHKPGCTCGFCQNKGKLPGADKEEKNESKEASGDQKIDEAVVELGDNQQPDAELLGATLNQLDDHNDEIQDAIESQYMKIEGANDAAFVSDRELGLQGEREEKLAKLRRTKVADESDDLLSEVLQPFNRLETEEPVKDGDGRPELSKGEQETLSAAPKPGSEKVAESKVAHIRHCPGHKNSKGEAAPWCVYAEHGGRLLGSYKSKSEAHEAIRNMKAHSGSTEKAAAIKKVAYVEHVPGHKNSKGEAAPWVVKSHETGKIISSHKSKAEAEKHLQDMHAHSGSSEKEAKGEPHEVDLSGKGEKFTVHEGDLHKALGIPEDQTIPESKLHEVMNDKNRSEHVRDMARSAIGLKHMHKGSKVADQHLEIPEDGPQTGAYGMDSEGKNPVDKAKADIPAGDKPVDAIDLAKAAAAFLGDDFYDEPVTKVANYTMKCPQCGADASKPSHGQPYFCPKCHWKSSEPKTSGMKKTASDRVIATLDDLLWSEPFDPENEDRPDHSLAEGLVSGPVEGGKHETNENAGPQNKVADFDTATVKSDDEVVPNKGKENTFVLGGPANSGEPPNADAVREQIATSQEMDKHETIAEKEAEVKDEVEPKAETTTVDTPAGKIVININAADRDWLQKHGFKTAEMVGKMNAAQFAEALDYLDGNGIVVTDMDEVIQYLETSTFNVNDAEDLAEVVNYLDGAGLVVEDEEMLLAAANEWWRGGFSVPTQQASAEGDYQVEPITSGMSNGNFGGNGATGADGAPDLAKKGSDEIAITADSLSRATMDFFTGPVKDLAGTVIQQGISSAPVTEGEAGALGEAAELGMVASAKVAEYNGWPNWETWHTKLLIDNDEPMYRTYQNLGRNAVKKNLTVGELAGQLSRVLAPAWKETKAYAEQNAHEMPDSEWAHMPIEQPDWVRIAEHCIDDAEEDKAYTHRQDEKFLQEMGVTPDLEGLEASAKQAAAKESGFNFWFPGQVLREFYPEVQHEIVDYPNADNKPMIQDVDLQPDKTGGSEEYDGTEDYNERVRRENEADERAAKHVIKNPRMLEDALKNTKELNEHEEGKKEACPCDHEAAGVKKPFQGQPPASPEDVAMLEEGLATARPTSPVERLRQQQEREHMSGKEAGSPNYVSTDPGAIGIGRDGKPQVLEGAPLRKEWDIRGPMFSDEFYANYPGVPGRYLASKRAANGKEDEKEILADFLKKVMGEIAVTFAAAFKVTSRPVRLDRVPGSGEVNLVNVENSVNNWPFYAGEVGGRIKHLLENMNDSDIQDAINDAWAQAAVWHDGSGSGNFTYEVFVRAESVDTDSMVLKYKFVTGTKGE